MEDYEPMWFFFSMCNNHTKDLKWIVPEAPLKSVKGMEIHMWYMESHRTSCMTNRASLVLYVTAFEDILYILRLSDW